MAERMAFTVTASDRASRVFRGIADAASKMGRRLAKVGEMATPSAIVSLGAAAAAALPKILALGNALASAAPAALVAIPAVLGLGAAFGTLKIATLGVGDAFKALVEGDSKKLNEALKKLSPSARQFVLAFKDIGPAFSKMKLGVQERLFKGLGAEMKLVAKALLPQLGRGFMLLGHDMNHAAKQVTGFAKSGDAVHGLNAVFNVASHAVEAFGIAIKPALRALTAITLAAAGPATHGFTAAGEAVARFSDKVTAAGKSGGLSKMIDKAVLTLGKLGRIGKNVAGVVAGIFKAADDGQSTLDTIERLTDKLNRLVNSVKGQEGLQKFFKMLSTAGPAIAGAAGVAAVLFRIGAAAAFLTNPVGLAAAAIIGLGAAGVYAYNHNEDFRKSVDKLAESAKRVGKAGLSEVRKTIEELAPQAIEAGASVLNLAKHIGDDLGAMAKDAAPDVLKLSTALGEMGKGAAADALRFVSDMADNLTKAWDKIAPVVTGLEKSFREKFFPAIEKVAKAFKDQLKPTMDSVTKAFENDVMPALDKLSKAYKDNKEEIDAVIAGGAKLFEWMGKLAAATAGPTMRALIALGGWLLGQGIRSLAGFIDKVGVAVRVTQAIGAAAVKAKDFLVGAFKTMALIALTQLGIIITGAAKAFGWAGPIGEKLRNAATEFESFSRRAKNALNNIPDSKEVAVRATFSWSHDSRFAGTGGPMEDLSVAGSGSWPLPGGFRNITSGFGEQRGGYRHGGVDIAAPTGTPIFATHGGRVVQSGWFGGGGNTVSVTSGNTVSRFMHMSRIMARAGSAVKPGQIVGLVGSTGNSTGPHVHWQVEQGGVKVNPLRREAGGRFWPGRAFMVGEKRPEVVEFDRPGRIHPSAGAFARSGGAGGGVTVNVNVSVDRTTDPVQVGRQIGRELDAYLKAGGKLTGL